MERKKDGALLKTDSSLKVWVTVRGARLHVPNEPAFEEAGYRWEDVQVVSPEVLALLPHIPPDGTLLREFGNPAVYLIRKGLRWWVKDEDTLVELMDQPDVDGQVIWVPRDATRDIEFGGMYPLPFLARPLLEFSAGRGVLLLAQDARSTPAAVWATRAVATVALGVLASALATKIF